MKHSIQEVSIEQRIHKDTQEKFIRIGQRENKIFLTLEQMPHFLQMLDRIVRDYSVQNICEEVCR